MTKVNESSSVTQGCRDQKPEAQKDGRPETSPTLLDSKARQVGSKWRKSVEELERKRMRNKHGYGWAKSLLLKSKTNWVSPNWSHHSGHKMCDLIPTHSLLIFKIQFMQKKLNHFIPICQNILISNTMPQKKSRMIKILIAYQWRLN